MNFFFFDWLKKIEYMRNINKILMKIKNKSSITQWMKSDCIFKQFQCYNASIFLHPIVTTFIYLSKIHLHPGKSFKLHLDVYLVFPTISFESYRFPLKGNSRGWVMSAFSYSPVISPPRVHIYIYINSRNRNWFPFGPPKKRV